MRFTKFEPELIQEADFLTLDQLQKLPEKRAVHHISMSFTKFFVNQINRGKLLDEHEDIAAIPVSVLDIAVGVLKDRVHRAYLAVAATFFVGKNPIYVIEREFFQAFKSINLDRVRYGNLPRNLTAYVQLPCPISDGTTTISGFFVYCGPRYASPFMHNLFPDELYSSRDIISCAFIGGDGSANTMHIPRLDDDTSIPDTIKNLTHTFFKKADGSKEESNVGYPEHYGIMLNLLAYLASGNPDLREFRNTLRYRGNSTEKVVNADRELSREDLILVGFNFMKDSNRTADSWYSKAHLGWRWCGAERKQLKLVFVRGSVKKWQKNEPDDPAEDTRDV